MVVNFFRNLISSTNRLCKYFNAQTISCEVTLSLDHIGSYRDSKDISSNCLKYSVSGQILLKIMEEFEMLLFRTCKTI